MYMINTFTFYKITNKFNKKCYVGLTSKNSLKRWKQHIDSSRRGSKYAFHCAIQKYGKESFELEDIGSLKGTLEQAENFESQLIIQHKSSILENGYNLKLLHNKPEIIRKPLSKEQKLLISQKTKEAMQRPEIKKKMLENKVILSGEQHPLYGKKHKSESINKMKETHKIQANTPEAKKRFKKTIKKIWSTPEIREKILHSLQNPSEETRKKMSVAKKGCIPWSKGKTGVYSQKTLEQMRTAKLGKKSKAVWTKESRNKVAEYRSKNWLVTLPDGNIQNVFNLTKFCKQHQLSQGTLRMTAIGLRKHHKGFSCKAL